METVKLATIGALASGGVSGVAGSALIGVEVSTQQLPSPFQTLDIACSKNTNSSKKVFDGLADNPEKVKEGVWTRPTSYASSLPSAPTGLTGQVTGCLRLTGNMPKNTYKEGEGILTIEMAAFKGDYYGIILLNSITNIGRLGGPTSTYRALFLEKSYQKGRITGGVQWSDEAFSRKMATAKKLKGSGLVDHNKEIDGDKKTVTGDAFSLFWKDTRKEKNIYQELRIEVDGSTPHPVLDFWNGNEEPMASDANISKATALFTDGQGRSISGECCKGAKSTIKAGFNIFKADKGGWEK